VIGGTNILLTMWGDHAAAPMNLVRLGYGLGAIFVNLLVRPFLTKNISPITSTLASNTVTETEANIFIPYSITAALCVLIAVVHLCFYIRVLKTEREELGVRQVMRNQKENHMKLSLTF
jgi:fucose permease